MRPILPTPHLPPFPPPPPHPFPPSASSPLSPPAASAVPLNEGVTPSTDTYELTRGTSAVAPDGTVYAFSGVTALGAPQFGLRRWAPAENRWVGLVRNPAYTQPDPPSRRFGGATILSSCWRNPVTRNLEPCFAMFGGIATTTPTPSAAQVWLAYDLTNSSGIGWSVASIGGSPAQRWNVAAAASPDGTILYLVGGDTAGGPSREIWALATQGFPNPRAGTTEWTNIARRTGVYSVASSFEVAPAATANRARDGNRNGNPTSNSCWRNNITLPATRLNPFWVLDTLVSQQIDQITVCQPTTCCRGQMSGYQVWVSDTNATLPWSGSPPSGARQIVTPAADISGQCVDIRTDVRARYVWIHLPGAQRQLTLCEVEVYQRVPMQFRQLSGTYSAAVGKPAFQTSRDNNQEDNQFGGDPERCFDGITSGAAPQWCKTSNSADPTKDVYVAVDLLREHDISSINLFPRTDSPDQRRNSRLELWVGNSRDFNGNTRVWGPNNFFTAGCNLTSTASCANAVAASLAVPMPGGLVRGRFVHLRRVPVLNDLTVNVLQFGEVIVNANRLLNEPTPRSGLSATTWGGYLVLFGGTTAAGVRLNEVRLFDVINGEWMPPVKVLGTPPAARMWGAMIAMPGIGIGQGWGVPSNRLLLTGGQGQTEALGDVSVLRFPQCPPLSEQAAVSISCSQAGTICFVTCDTAYSTPSNTGPVRCRQDGTWAGNFPLCLVSTPTAPIIRSVAAGSAPGTALVSFSAPPSPGFALSFTRYRIGVYDSSYIQQFSQAGFTDGNKWVFKGGNTPQSGLYGFLPRGLYLDSCPVCDCNTRNQQCSVLHREFPTEFVNPQSNFAYEMFVSFPTTGRVALDNQAVGICIYDNQETFASTTQPGLCEFYVQLRRSAGVFQVGMESNSLTFRSYQRAPVPSAFLRIERDWTNRRWRGGYKFNSNDAWSYFPYQADSILLRGVNSTDAEAVPAASMRIGLIMKNWNTLLRSYAVSGTEENGTAGKAVGTLTVAKARGEEFAPPPPPPPLPHHLFPQPPPPHPLCAGDQVHPRRPH